MRPIEAGSPGRRPATEVPSITGLRLMPADAEATLVNISTTGLLAESVTRVSVGSAVRVVIQGGFSPASIAGRAARCEVAAMGRDGLIRYAIGIEFDSPITLDDEPEEPPPPPVTQGVRNRW